MALNDVKALEMWDLAWNFSTIADSMLEEITSPHVRVPQIGQLKLILFINLQPNMIETVLCKSSGKELAH